jgi:hypothetical protein
MLDDREGKRVYQRWDWCKGDERCGSIGVISTDLEFSYSSTFILATVTRWQERGRENVRCVEDAVEIAVIRCQLIFAVSMLLKDQIGAGEDFLLIHWI